MESLVVLIMIFMSIIIVLGLFYIFGIAFWVFLYLLIGYALLVILLAFAAPLYLFVGWIVPLFFVVKACKAPDRDERILCLCYAGLGLLAWYAIPFYGKDILYAIVP